MRKSVVLPTKKRVLISVLCIFLSIPLILIPVVTVVVYETIFGSRYQTAAWMDFTEKDYPDLKMERSDFQSDGGFTLAGYQYRKDGQEIKGVVVVAHGLGGGGHKPYLPFINFFTSNGYYVFTYDVRGNDNSPGHSVEGLPQGIVDLDYALRHVAKIKAYQGLPVVLFGHSWGAFSVGNVLNMHPHVEAAVMISGFNESDDMLRGKSEPFVGKFAVNFLLPYVILYEDIKFGREFTAISAIEGIKKTDADILIVHSKDDDVVPASYGYNEFYETFKDEERIEFILYEDKGHSDHLYSEKAISYREQLKIDYWRYVISNDLPNNSETMDRYLLTQVDRPLCFEPNPELAEKILTLYDARCTK